MGEERLANLRTTYVTLDGLTDEYDHLFDPVELARIRDVRELVRGAIEDEQEND